jgi:D-alanyl-D-alanine carboxypeptidase/D-alanyl-D-alanine-endopeptidase (penicillin-binding protein 4)
MRLRVLALLAAGCAALAGAAPADALDQPTLQRKLASEMALARTFAGAYVRDLDTGATLFASNQDVPRPPASVEKLYTTATALLRFGPDAALATTVAGEGALDPLGVWRGNLYLRGGGDPTLDRPAIARLAVTLEDAGISRVAGSIVGDESLFDTLRGSYNTGFAYDRDIGGFLSALSVSGGWSKDGSPAKEAARRLAAALRADGVRVDGPSDAGPTPADAHDLASLPSPPMRDLIRLTNVPSNNFFAETLVKDLGARYGGAGTTPGGTAVVRAQMAAFGIHPQIFDGSGLSRADRTTPRQVVRLIERMHGQEVAGAFEGSLPVAGRTGTLSRRMRGTSAQDRCHAKTGTLIGVSSLAGYCDAAGGHVIAFAFLMSRASVARAHAVQDRMAAAIAGYSDAPPSSSASSPGSSRTFTPRRSAFSSLDPGLSPATT